MTRISELTDKELIKLYQRTYLELQRWIVKLILKEKDENEREKLRAKVKELGEIYKITIEKL